MNSGGSKNTAMNRDSRSVIPKKLRDYVDGESINDNIKSQDPHRRSMEVWKSQSYQTKPLANRRDPSNELGEITPPILDWQCEIWNQSPLIQILGIITSHHAITSKVERLFNLVNVTKDKRRNRMKTKSLEALITIKRIYREFKIFAPITLKSYLKQCWLG